VISLQWNPEVTFGDALTIVGFVFTILTLVFTALEIRRNTLAQRIKFLLDLTERYFSDTAVRKFFYKVDYRQFRFDEDTFTGTDEERWLDSLLYTFDLIGFMVRTKAVRLDEVRIIAFQASRVLNNDEVKKYLLWLDEEHAREGQPERAHDDARYLIEKTMVPARA
jgi:hypothetical protein